MTVKAFLSLAAVLVLSAACTPMQPSVSRMAEPDLSSTRAAPPPGARPGACWSKDATPAIIETVTDQIVLQPAQIASNGAVLQPAIYKTETRQQIVQERRELWFEIPCEVRTSPVFIASLQRALSVRGLYAGDVSGAYDAPTRAAVRSFQAPQGLDSGVLSLAAARQLGLSSVVPQ